MRLSPLKAAFFSTASIFALSSIAAQAQDQAASAGAGQPVETVTVTGSLVITDIANSPTPITAVTSDQLLSTTPSDISAALDKLPVFMGSTGSGTSKIGSTSNGAASNLNLRDFGTNRTLVLFDDHRIVNTQANGAVNTDILPEMLIQRVDVVTGGASAVYGSDAVTGVVNFILNKNFDGLKYEANAGTNENLLGTEYQAGVAAGSDLFGDRGHIEGTVRYSHTDQVLVAQLPYGNDGQAYVYDGTGTKAAPFFIIGDGRINNSPFGGLISCAGCSANGETFVSNGIIGPYNKGTVPSTAFGTLSEGGNGGYTQDAGYSPEERTVESFARFSYDLNSDTVASLEVRDSQAEYYNVSGFNNITSGARPNTFAVNNPYLPAAAQAALAAGNPGCPGGVPTSIAVAPACTFSMTNVFGSLAPGSQSPGVPTGTPYFLYKGVDGDIAVTADVTGEWNNRWDWDLYYTHDESRESSTSPQNENLLNAYAADDAVQLSNGQIVCYVSTTSSASQFPGCQALNPFGPASVTATQYASVLGVTHYVMENGMDDLGGHISGNIFDLPAGPVKAALSAETRWMTYAVNSNAGINNSPTPGLIPSCAGLRMCSTTSLLWYQGVLPTVPEKRENVSEVAGEINLPLLKDVPLAQDLSIDMAGRYTDYTTSGSVETWKVGFDWHVIDDLKFRGTTSVDIRAPQLNDLYYPPTASNAGVTDLLTGLVNDVNVYTTGNPNLKPEVAHTYTVGAVLTPTFIPNLTASVDYYRINLYDAITSLSYSTTAIQEICITSGGTSPYCALQSRPFPFTNTTAANFPTALYNQELNSAVQKTEGVDFEIDYSFDLDDAVGLPGKVQAKNLYSYQPFITNIQYPGATPIFTAMPKSRDTLFINYSLNNWGIALQDRWLGGYDQTTAPGQYFLTEEDLHIPNYNQIDLTIDKKFLMANDSVADFYVSIVDLTGALYPIAPATNSGSNPGFNYPAPAWGYSLGRYFTIGVRGNL